MVPMCPHTCDSQAYSARWWMANYLSKTPKRHVMWSNSKCIGLLDLGKLRFNYQSSEYNKNRTAKKTISKSTGKRQFTGQRKQLKESQHLKIIGHVVLNGLWLSYVFVCLVCTCSRVCVCVCVCGEWGPIWKCSSSSCSHTWNGRLSTFLCIHTWLVWELLRAHQLLQPTSTMSIH